MAALLATEPDAGAVQATLHKRLGTLRRASGTR